MQGFCQNHLIIAELLAIGNLYVLKKVVEPGKEAEGSHLGGPDRANRETVLHGQFRKKTRQ
jgi:hypothetical protein